MRSLLAIALLLLALPALANDIKSPHGKDQACDLCHDPVDEGAAPEQIPFRAGGPDAMCKSCHEDDPHAVGMPPERAEVPEHMFLVDGELACLSCHDEPACEGEGISPADPYFLRGGPYDSIGGLCAQCHRVTGTERFNPHKAMAEDADPSETCLHCHLEMPDPEDDRVDLKVDGPNICLGCHPESPHAGAETHLGPIPAVMQDPVRASGLPVRDDEEIVCITCHDPHPGGTVPGAADQGDVGEELFPPRWLTDVLKPALDERGHYTPKHTEPGFLRKPLQDGRLCQSCHTPKATEALRDSREDHP